MDVTWLTSIAGQCQAAGVPVYVKQDSGTKSGLHGRIPDAIWALKQFPASGPASSRLAAWCRSRAARSPAHPAPPRSPDGQGAAVLRCPL
jgi:hypothetical protein